MATPSPPPPASAPVGKIDLGLGRIAAVLAALGDPQARFPAVHVAGTNGKGSTCAFVEAGLAAAGCEVGKFVSPFLVHPRDAVTIGGAVVGEAAWDAALGRVQAAVDALLSEQRLASPLTTFEQWTAAAFLLFAEAPVDVAVVEVGVGGREDATNVLPVPLAAAITPIGMDHVALLGPTQGDIARHKAGIIKPGGWAAVAAAQPAGVLDVCAAEAAAVGGATLAVVPPLAWHDRPSRLAVEPATGAIFPVPLRGDFQLDNAALAVAVLRHVAAAGGSAFARLADDATIARGFAACTWRGRFERVTVALPPSVPAETIGGDSGGTAAPLSLSFWLDGGHNAHAIARVRDEVDALLAEGRVQAGATAAPDGSNGSVLFVYGGTDSRDVSENLALLLRRGDAVFGVPFGSPPGMPWIRCQPPATVAQAAQRLLGADGVDARAFSSLEEGLRAAAAEVARTPRRMLVVCGSLYLVSEVYRLIERSGKR